MKQAPQLPQAEAAAMSRGQQLSCHAVRAVLAAVLLLAAALRLAGVEWGLPDITHPGYSFHPDEAACIVWGQWLAQGHLIAKQFIYGGTLYYSILNAYWHYGQLLSPLLHGISPMADAILFGRLVVVACSLLTVLLVYHIGKRLFGVATGLLAAAFLALAPAHVFLAQNVRPDEIGTLLVMLLLLVSSTILRGAAEADRRRFVAAGLVLGAAIALRAPLLVFGAAPVLAWLLRERGAGWLACLGGLLRWRLQLLAAVAVIAYAVASPYSLLHPDWLLRGILVQQYYQAGTFADAIDRGPRILQYGWSTLREALGTPLYLLGAAAAVLACLRPTTARLLLLVPVLCYFALLLLISWVVVRYTLPLAPLLVLLAAGALTDAAQRFPRWRGPLYAASALALAWTLAGDLAFLRVQTGANVREMAGAWIEQYVPAGATVVEMQQYEEDVYGNPVIPQQYRVAHLQVHRGEAAKLLEGAEGHDYLVLNEQLYDNMERLPPGRLSPGIDVLRRVVHSGSYVLVSQISRPVEFLGVDFSALYTSQDYRIINPAQRIYRFVGAAVTKQSVDGRQ